jgi:cGMP-dependent protein kinase 1
LEGAKAEIRNLRKVLKEFQDKLHQEKQSEALRSGGGGNVVGPKKRAAVLDRGEQVKSSAEYVPKVIEKPKAIRDLLLGIVTTNILFSSYTIDEHNAIVDAFESESVPENNFVIRQGDPGEKFYVVQSGTLDIYVRGAGGDAKVGNQLGPGSCFGELALMYNTPRAASIKSVAPCVIWAIDRTTYRGILVYYKYLRNSQYMEFLRKVVIKDKPLGAIMNEGMYLVHTDLLMIAVHFFLFFPNRTTVKWGFYKLAELEKMTVSLEREQYEAGETIIRQGNTGDHFYIIADGSVGVFKTDAAGKETKVSVLKQGAYFGEKALLQEDVRQASCVAESKVLCLTLGREDFIDMMGSLDDLMTNSTIGGAPPAPAPAPALDTSTGGYLLNVALTDLDVRNTLGCGAFGRVKLCRLASQDKYFALKCQSKKGIVESGLQEHVLNEMRIMRKIDHPYIAKLYIALQDNVYIYFLLELLQGGELFTYLRGQGKLSEQSAKFYAATVVYAFSLLHAKKIAYRDLKPENLVMDTNGYIKLVDFGLAKYLPTGKTWTLCGTPDYLAPVRIPRPQIAVPLNFRIKANDRTSVD